MPDGWKQRGVYRMVYAYPASASLSCSVVLVSLGPCLVVHGEFRTLTEFIVSGE